MCNAINSCVYDGFRTLETKATVPFIMATKGYNYIIGHRNNVHDFMD